MTVCPVCDAQALTEVQLGGTRLLHCGVCTVTITHPDERPEDPTALYTGEYTLTQTVRASAEQHRYFRYPEYWTLVGEITALLPPPGRWLDIGCDHGFFLDEVRRAGFDAVGVELSLRATAYAKRIGLEVHESVNDVHGEIDVISMWHMLEHIDDPNDMIAWCTRALRPDGLLCIRVPDFDSIWRKIFRQRWIWFHPRVHVMHYTEHSIRVLLQRHGLEVVFIRRQRPNTRLTKAAGRLARRVFQLTMEVPAPSVRDRIARVYQDITGAEIFAIARRVRS
jgi:SAM-dependent methyltransferase